MNKFKEILDFYKKVPMISKFRIIKTFIDLPAAFFHELCHIIVAILLFQKIVKIQCNYWYEIEDDYFKSYEFVVITEYSDTKTGHLLGIFVNIAPVLGIIMLIYLSFLMKSIMLFCYLIFSINIFWLSKQDVENFKANFKKVINK